MSGLPAHETSVLFSADDTTYATIPGKNSVSLSTSRETLDVTDFDDASGARKRILGLKDYGVSLSGHYRPGTNQDDIFNALVAGDFDGTVYIRILWDGSSGVTIPCVIASVDISAELEGTVEISVEAESDGQLVIESA